ncbi:hypothetical protein NDU88_002195 [Pleurodeles waltl]|uniref:Uncharacterized protein n=1 Tax=Pleurodeles waltl TaxID=8319 RepID=A0AAV7TJX2_PLEWA|nr:hypothetical protein NDU88_002195 [Pleurodeles waltl]
MQKFISGPKNICNGSSVHCGSLHRTRRRHQSPVAEQSRRSARDRDEVALRFWQGSAREPRGSHKGAQLGNQMSSTAERVVSLFCSDLEASGSTGGQLWAAQAQSDFPPAPHNRNNLRAVPGPHVLVSETLLRQGCKFVYREDKILFHAFVSEEKNSAADHRLLDTNDLALIKFIVHLLYNLLLFAVVVSTALITLCFCAFVQDKILDYWRISSQFKSI